MTLLQRMLLWVLSPRRKPVRMHEWSEYELKKDPHTRLIVLCKAEKPHCVRCGEQRDQGYESPTCPGQETTWQKNKKNPRDFP